MTAPLNPYNSVIQPRTFSGVRVYVFYTTPLGADIRELSWKTATLSLNETSVGQLSVNLVNIGDEVTNKTPALAQFGTFNQRRASNGIRITWDGRFSFNGKITSLYPLQANVSSDYGVSNYFSKAKENAANLREDPNYIPILSNVAAASSFGFGRREILCDGIEQGALDGSDRDISGIAHPDVRTGDIVRYGANYAYSKYVNSVQFDFGASGVKMRIS